MANFGSVHIFVLGGWREGAKVKNVYLGSCRKMTEEEALEKARRLKSEAFGV